MTEEPGEFVIVAVDPGRNGGIVWNHAGQIHAVKMPANEFATVELLNQIAGKSPLVELHLEQPSTGGWGKAGLSSIAKLFFGVGTVYGSGVAFGWKVNTVDPRKWQSALGLKRNKLGKTDWKNLLKQKAGELYPDLPITLATSDAVLIYHAAVNGLIY
jgi:hypothetical protein